MKLHYPLKEIFVTSPFGGDRKHNGIDYRAAVGTPVYASADGKVEWEGYGANNPLFGSVAGIAIMLEHQVGWTGYAHLSASIVDIGQPIKKGQLIGYSGATGEVTGPHLHFERFPDNYNTNNGYWGRIDPQPELDKEDNPAPVPPPTDCEYKVVYGDTLSQIAVDNKTTVAQLMEWNPIIKNPDYIQAGWTLKVC